MIRCKTKSTCFEWSGIKLALKQTICPLLPALWTGLWIAQGISPAHATQHYEGPVPARVLDVYDGDTIRVMAEVWPHHEIDVRIRIRGIDAPEIRTRCKAEKRAGYIARDSLSDLIGDSKLYLSNISGGKYYNRILADVELPDGTNLADYMLQEHLVTPYSGGRRKRNCELFR